MKQLKLILSTFLLLTLILSLTLPCAADILLPPKDDFYRAHTKECRYNYYDKYSAKGAVSLYTSPEDTAVVRTLADGEEVLIPYIYTDEDNVEWGMIEDATGWLKMSDLEFIYTIYVFNRTHQLDKYVEGSYEIYADAQNPVILWEWPDGNRIDGVTLTNTDFQKRIYHTYTDENDRVWAPVTYNDGEYAYICLTNPYSTDINVYVEPKPTASVSSSNSQGKSTQSSIKSSDSLPQDMLVPPHKELYESDLELWILTGSLIILLAVVTCIIIAIFFGRKKRK